MRRPGRPRSGEAWGWPAVEKYRQSLRGRCATIKTNINQKARKEGRPRLRQSLDDMVIQFEKQEGACGLCRAVPEPEHLTHGLAYDHDHDTGEGRGWLCPRCNLAEGFVKAGWNIPTLAAFQAWVGAPDTAFR